MARRLPPEVLEAFVGLYEGTFFELMVAMTRAEPVEAAYAKFLDAARQRTKKQLRRVARLAGEYFVQHANPSPAKMPKEKVTNLTVKAIEFALNQPENEKDE